MSSLYYLDPHAPYITSSSWRVLPRPRKVDPTTQFGAVDDTGRVEEESPSPKAKVKPSKELPKGSRAFKVRLVG